MHKPIKGNKYIIIIFFCQHIIIIILYIRTSHGCYGFLVSLKQELGTVLRMMWAGLGGTLDAISGACLRRMQQKSLSLKGTDRNKIGLRKCLK